MTDRPDPQLELVDDDGSAIDYPPTEAQRLWIREAVRLELGAQMKPILTAWDNRSRDMLDVLREAGDVKAQVRSTLGAVKLAGWAGVFVLILSAVALWSVLEQERADRRLFREQEQLRRIEAAQLVIDAGREDVRRIDALVRDMGLGCAKSTARN